MKLHVGERLSGSGPRDQPGGYVVTEVIGETPWHGFYAGKRILYNFDFAGKRSRETDEKEWLDVLLRTNRYPYLDDPQYLARRRELVRTELRNVLGGSGDLWPEPIDLLEIANSRDAFTFSQAGAELEPITVLARPHGQLLSDWRRQSRPMTTTFAVLAELLEFIDQAHQSGLLLHGMGPASILIDRAERVHYVGTDMVTPLDSFTPSSPMWAKIFPAERFPQGFSPPERFASPPAGRPPTSDLRLLAGDLYAWGSLAFFLLTDLSPAQIALDQARPWAHFQDAHFALLENALKPVSAAHAAAWLEQLGIEPHPSKMPAWPDAFLELMKFVLHPDPRRRPANVTELRRWLAAPPPPVVGALLALRVSPTEARIFLDPTNIEAKAHILVRRAIGRTPKNAADGELVMEGDFKRSFADKHLPTAVDRSTPISYSAFIRRQIGADIVYSPGTVTVLRDPSRGNLQRLAEKEASQMQDGDEVPARVRLFFKAMEPAVAAEALLASAQPRVRSWALTVLRELRESKSLAPAAAAKIEAVLWPALRDPAPGLRLDAARALLTSVTATDEFVQKLVKAMGTASVDESVQAALSLKSIGVADDLLRLVVNRLQGERSESCPVCQQKVAPAQHLEHLRAHGYVELDGVALPRNQALARLWDRVFLEGSQPAHDQLLTILAPEPGGDNKAPPYVASLEEALAEAPMPTTSLERLIHCLRQSKDAACLIPFLLRSKDARPREVGREVLLPLLDRQLWSASCTPEIIRQALEQVCPGPDLLEEKILLCQRLPQVGVDEKSAAICLAQLQDQRLVTCGECSKWVPVRDLETHLLTDHHICQFRGVRSSTAEMKTTLLDALCQKTPDVAAARMLEALAQAQGSQSDDVLATWLCQRLVQTFQGERPAALSAVAEAFAAMGASGRLLPPLLDAERTDPEQTLARSLALEFTARLTVPPDKNILARIKSLLTDAALPDSSRQDAVIGLMRIAGNDESRAHEFLAAYIASSNKARALEQLRDLEKRLGKSPMLDRLQAETVEQVPMMCSACSREFARKDMSEHLWEEHRLVLDGWRVRQPWRAIEDWVVDYRLEKDPAVLQRCTELARNVDGADGVLRLQQLMLKHGVEDAQAWTDVLERAEDQHATVCPRCFQLTPIPRPVDVFPLAFEEGQFEGRGYRLRAAENGLFPTVTIATEEELVYKGQEPGRWFTRLGAAVVLFIPIVAALFILMKLLGNEAMSSTIMFIVAIVSGLLMSGVIYLAWPRLPPKRDRLVDAAWTLLVPDLLKEKLTGERAAFLGALAVTSRGRGKIGVRAALLESCLETFDDNDDPNLPPAHAALIGLRLDDLVQDGKDPFPTLLEVIRSCLAGRHPLALLELLLTDMFVGNSGQPVVKAASFDDAVVKAASFDDAEVEAGSSDNELSGNQAWNKRRSRLKILLVEALFAAGVELRDLPDLAQAYPSLGAILDVRNSGLLVGLRYLSSLKKSKPWAKHGRAMTVFDLAAEFEQTEALLKKYPGLLLSVTGQPIFHTVRALWCKDVCMLEKPRTLEVHRLPGKGGYQLILGQEHIWFRESPDELLEGLKDWIEYFFDELKPGWKKWPLRRGGDGMKKLVARNSCPCSHCGAALLPLVGAVGVDPLVGSHSS